MPVYEFQCLDCMKRFTDLVGMTGDKSPSKCPHCGSSQNRKLVSRFARYRSEDDRMDEMSDQLDLMGEPDSPTAMRDMVREMGKAMDEDMSDEMEELFETDMEGGFEDGE